MSAYNSYACLIILYIHVCYFLQDHQTVSISTQWNEGDACKTVSNASCSEHAGIAHLQDKVDKLTSEIEKLSDYEQNKFSLDKIKDDNKTMLFYTGFVNYDVFENVFKYLETKGEKLQYWRGKNKVSHSKQYQSQGVKPGQKRKLSLKEEFFYSIIEA